MALKVLHNPDSETFSKRFLNEGRTIASLSHPNIITVYDVGIVAGWHYISMEYVECGDLAQRIVEGISASRALTITQAMAICLQFAHDHGVIHRDVKPANILFRTEDCPVLTDFGIAKQFEANTDLTMTGTTMGTPHYMSPEQAIAESVDGRSDIYSLGVILYEMLTGEKPYVGDSVIATLVMHIRTPIPKLPGVYRHYQKLLDRMIAKAPQQRFTNAEEIVDVIETLSRTNQKKASGTHGSAVSRLKQFSTGSYFSEKLSKILPSIKDIRARLGSMLNRDHWPSLRPMRSPVAPDAKTTRTDFRSLCRRIDWPSIGTKSSGIKQNKKIVGVGLGTLLLIVIVVLTYSYDKQSGRPLLDSQRQQPKTKLTAVAASLEQAKDESVEPKESLPNELTQPIDILSQPTDAPDDVSNALDTEPSNTALVTETSAQPIQSPGQEMQKLLILAKNSLDDYQLTTPPQTNALYYYQKVLDLDPNNKDAQRGFSEIAKRYSWLVGQRIEQGEYNIAEAYINRGLQVDPGNLILIAQSQTIDELKNQSIRVLNEPPVEDSDEDLWTQIKNLFD